MKMNTLVNNSASGGRTAGNKGFTLIETLIGLMVFSIGTLAVMALTIGSMNDFANARTGNLEINKTALQLESLKHTGYRDNLFFDPGASTLPVVGSDGAYMDYSYMDDAIVRGTKLIALQNTKIKSANGLTNNLTFFYTKALIE